MTSPRSAETVSDMDDGPTAWALIPARGGSKGIPRKNLRLLGGRPLVAHSICAARDAKTIDDVFVSTDAPEIAATARQWGANVVDRPAEISGDDASSESALLHALETLSARGRQLPDLTVFLQCTSPLTRPEDIDGTVRVLLEAQADSALAVTDFHYFVWAQGDGQAVGVNHDKAVRPTRQQRQPQFLETGAVYVMRTAGLRDARHRFFGKTVMYHMPAERVLEIDEPPDLELASMRMLALGGYPAGALPSPVEAVFLDFDGVLTDDRVWVDQDGRESVACNRRDGMGIGLLRQAGIPVIVVSKEQNPVVAARCRKLDLPVHQAVDDKPLLLDRIIAEMSLRAEACVFVGNDVNDIECMRRVGCGVAPADAHPAALRAADVVLQTGGGHGAVREICDRILADRHLRHD